MRTLILFSIIILNLAFGPGSARAETQATPEPETLLGKAPPYIPRKIDYSFELGLMGSKDDLFWLSGLMGANLGNCIFTNTETCQQYIDTIVGVAVREAETQTHLWLSPRWQYVNLPDRYSTYWRLIGGVASVARPDSDRGYRGVFGAGVGVTTYLHDKVDLRLEARVVELDRAYYQVVMAANIKVERLLTYFVKKLGDIGKGTISTAIEATGTAIKATGEGLGGIVKGVSAPFKKDEKKKEQQDKQ